MENNNTIIFRMGEETGIVIEKTKEQFEHSLFREQYKQALNIISTIIDYKDEDKDAPMSNIVAFCGDRGEGKTSALMTIRNILIGGDAYEESKDLFPKDNKIKENSFKVLNLVDPAFFDDKHNLLELLIGQMYADILKDDDEKANKKDDCTCGINLDIAKRNHLIQLFHDVHKSLSLIDKSSNKSAYDNLEEVADLAAAIELKEDLNKLMRCYAKYFGKDRVLISIDDLDLNVTEGYTMAEEIRKYLSSPSACVVLMSIKIEQMVEVVQSYLRNKLSKEIIPNNTITDMAIRYVTKMIPESHRVKMPSGENIVEKKLILKWNIDNQEDYPSVKEAVVRYIFRKTGYIFINGRSISPIVPTNLRSVRLLIGKLWNMPEAKDEKGIDNLKNKEDFKDYFNTSWLNGLTNSNQLFVESLVHNEDVVSINKNVVMHLKDMLFPTKDQMQQLSDIKDEILKAILNPLNAMQNISLGDVFYVMNYAENTLETKEDKQLIVFLRAFYSMKLYDNYNVISESEQNLFPNTEGNVSIYKYDIKIQKRNLLQRLVNGAYFTYKAGEILPRDRRNNPREKRVINGKELIQKFKELNPSSSKEQKLLCEFFVLTTTYPAFSWQGTEYNRELTSRSYYDNFSDKNNYLVFDALSIFYNVINIKQTYQRWNDIYNIGRKDKRDYYADTLADKDSLLYNMMAICDEKHPWSSSTSLPSKLHRFISEAVVRFSEVQLAIQDNLINNRDTQKTGGSLFNLQYLYQYIQKINIQLYPIKKGEGAYEMKFWFLDPIINYLSNPKLVTEEKFNQIFQLEETNKRTIATLESTLGGSILGLNATSKVTGKELRDRVSNLDDADLLEEIDWDSIFEEEEKYSRNDVIAILSQTPNIDILRRGSVSLKTREDTIQRATTQARNETAKLFEAFSKEINRQVGSQIAEIAKEVKNLSKSFSEEKKRREKIEKNLVYIDAPDSEDKPKKKAGRPKKNNISETNN